jgi:hypothetical protein
MLRDRIDDAARCAAVAIGLREVLADHGKRDVGGRRIEQIEIAPLAQVSVVVDASAIKRSPSCEKQRQVERLARDDFLEVDLPWQRRIDDRVQLCQTSQPASVKSTRVVVQ